MRILPGWGRRPPYAVVVDELARMTVANGGGDDRGPDAHSHGRRGLADRLAVAVGELRVRPEDSAFTLKATVPAPS